MTGRTLQILLVEDNPADADLLQETLAALGEPLQIAHRRRFQEAADYLRQGAPADAVLLDLMLPDSSGLATLDSAVAAAPHLPIVVLTGLDDESLGLAAVQQGAQDYLVKCQTSPRRLLQTLRHSVQRKRLEEELKTLNQTLEERVAERTKAIEMLHVVAAMANQAQNVEQAIDFCLRQVAIYDGWCFGHAFLPAADDPEEVVPVYAFYAKEPERFRRFREATFCLRLRRGQGLPGRVFASGKPEWTTGVHDDLIERRACTAENLGIGTAIAFPVVVGEKVAAVLEFFSDRVAHPERAITEVMVDVGLQLGRVIERAEFEEHLLTVADDTLRNIAQEIHDDVGQELTALGLFAETLAEAVAPAASRAGKLAAAVLAGVGRTHEKVRRLCHGLLPRELEEGLLANALEQLAATTSDNARLRCKFDCAHPDPVFDSHISLHLYRIAQEAVSNALRHGGAGNIAIGLDWQDGETVLAIEDDGKGLSCEGLMTEGMGQRTMRYRAGLIGGRLAVGPGPTRGTRVECRLATAATVDSWKAQKQS